MPGCSQRVNGRQPSSFLFPCPKRLQVGNASRDGRIGGFPPPGPPAIELGRGFSFRATGGFDIILG